MGSKVTRVVPVRQGILNSQRIYPLRVTDMRRYTFLTGNFGASIVISLNR
jgi:hypothetical protein